MMNLEQVQQIVVGGESHTVEFKKSTRHIETACKTACAFLNGDGGYILFGVTDDKRIVGQEVSDKTKREIGNELTKITPVAVIEASYVPLPNSKLYVIVFHIVTDVSKRPYMYDGKAFLRNQSTTTSMPLEYIQQLTLLNANGKYAWENQPLPDITIDDMDVEEIMTTIREGSLNGRIPQDYRTNDPWVALQRLGLLEDGKITNAGFVLFGKEPQRKYPQCTMRLARFRGTNKNEFIDNKRATGHLFKLLNTAMAFLNTYLPIASTFPEGEFLRKDTPLFPIIALREAVANALAHRDYSYYSGGISLAIYDDRVEIWNYGLFPTGVTLDSLRQLNRSMPRNPRIANVLYYHKIFESWGRGVNMIIDECKKAGHPEPVYSQDPVGTALTLPSKFLLGTTLSPHDIQNIPNDIIPSQQKQPQLHISARQQEILSILKQHPQLTTDEIGLALSQPISKRWLRIELNNLKDAGYINSLGNTRSRMWSLQDKEPN